MFQCLINEEMPKQVRHDGSTRARRHDIRMVFHFSLPETSNQVIQDIQYPQPLALICNQHSLALDLQYLYYLVNKMGTIAYQEKRISIVLSSN